MESGKACKKTTKNEDPETLKSMVSIRKIAKNATSTLLQQTPHVGSKMRSKWRGNLKSTYLGAMTKRQQKRNKNNKDCTEKHPPEGEPRTRLSHPKTRFYLHGN